MIDWIGLAPLIYLVLYLSNYPLSIDVLHVLRILDYVATCILVLCIPFGTYLIVTWDSIQIKPSRRVKMDKMCET